MAILRQEWQMPAERVHLLYPGVDTTQFVPGPPDPATRARLGWADRTVVLCVGRLQKRKGHDRMIEALPRIRRAIPEILFAIVGDGEQREPLRELVQRLDLGDHVRFHGESDDEQLIQCYQQCDLFALPNRQVGRDIEGFGMVLLEAQACGKPVLAGASGGTAETMRIPETGQITPCEDPAELADVVIELLSDRDRLSLMGKAARRWVIERFDWEALSREALQLFSQRSETTTNSQMPSPHAETPGDGQGTDPAAPGSGRAVSR